MNHLRIQGIVLLLIMTLNPAIKAQECSYYLPLVENTGLEFENYNHRDRLEGTNKVIITNVENTGNEVIATLRSEYFDRRNRIQHEGEYNVICRANVLTIDMQSVIDQTVLEGFQGMDLTIESDELLLPANLTAGKTLPDAVMTITARSGGVQIAEITIHIEDRQVIGKETLSVPAGRFDTYKISYNTRVITSAMGIPIRTGSRTIEYHAPNVGMVRSEFFDNRDRPQGYTVLSQIL